MSFTATGRDLAMARNPRTGKFDLQWDDTGNPSFDDRESHRVLSLLVERRGEWWADTRGNRGSRLHTVKEIRRTAPSTIESFAREALDKAIAEGAIRPVTNATGSVRATKAGPTRIDLAVTYQAIKARATTLYAGNDPLEIVKATRRAILETPF